MLMVSRLRWMKIGQKWGEFGGVGQVRFEVSGLKLERRREGVRWVEGGPVWAAGAMEPRTQTVAHREVRRELSDGCILAQVGRGGNGLLNSSETSAIAARCHDPWLRAFEKREPWGFW
jgi:hypothetical protein